MKEYSVIGKRLPRVDGAVKVTGEAKYTGDMVLPRMLYGKILRSPHAHARILNIDTSKAERLPGVKAVITGKEIGGGKYGSLTDNPQFMDEYPLAIDKVRYIGDEVAAVAAIDEYIAGEALGLIEVDYEELPAVFDPEEAMREDAPRIHDQAENNVILKLPMNFGDVEKGFRESDYIREDKFVVAGLGVAMMEPQIALSSFDSTGKLTIWTSTQTPHFVQRDLARVLGMTMGNVRVIKPYIGGGHCGKLDLQPHQICSALLSKKTGCPVKIELTRKESFTINRGIQPLTIKSKTGVKKDGTILAKDWKFIVDAGGYNGFGVVSVLLAGLFINLPYRLSHVKYEGYAVYTNKPTGGSERGSSIPAVQLAQESQLDIIAGELGIDPVELRLKNAIQSGDITLNGFKITSCGLTECIQKVVEESGWEKKEVKSSKTRGKGIACESMCSGGKGYEPHDASAAFLNIQEDGTVTLLTGASDLGQGSDTVLSQIAAEILGVELKNIKITSADTELTPIDLGSLGSRCTNSAGNAVKVAALDAQKQLLKVAAERLGVGEEALEAREGRIYIKENPEKGLTLPQVVKASLKKGEPVMGKGYYNPPSEPMDPITGKGNISSSYSFGAQVAEVEVDTETGQVKVLNLTAAHDCGFALNPIAVEGQIEGQVGFGVGKALSEELLIKGGRILNPTFLDYRVPRTLDAPRIKTMLVETIDPNGPFGAKECGEGPLCATAPAIANAIYNAIGVRIKGFPITPEKVLEALRLKEKN